MSTSSGHQLLLFRIVAIQVNNVVVASRMMILAILCCCGTLVVVYHVTRYLTSAHYPGRLLLLLL